MKKSKRKSHPTLDPTWNTETYGATRNPFNMEYLKYYNNREGKDQIIFLYTDKISHKIQKYKIL